VSHQQRIGRVGGRDSMTRRFVRVAVSCSSRPLMASRKKRSTTYDCKKKVESQGEPFFEMRDKTTFHEERKE